MVRCTMLVVLLLLLAVPLTQADANVDPLSAQNPNVTTDPNEPNESPKSPWLITPLLTSDPKISTALGLLAGYVHQFDAESPPSLFGVTGTYSTTDSYYFGAFAKVHFGQDRHRVMAGAFTGQVNNDYSDYLGSGLDVQTTDELKAFGLRYLRQIHGHWYLGPQFFATNYAISAEDALTGGILDEIGLTGFTSNGLGLLVQYDSRDNQYSSASGQMFEAHNTAYREALGGDINFDAYNADYQYYFAHGNGHVLALHAKGRWTNGAPVSGYSSADLRGYSRGQYLAPHMTLVEADERISLTNKWGLTVFLGLAVLYGGDTEGGTDNLYPAGGGGISYRLNEDKMVVRAEYAIGKEGNQGFYLKFGHPF